MALTMTCVSVLSVLCAHPNWLIERRQWVDKRMNQHTLSDRSKWYYTGSVIDSSCQRQFDVTWVHQVTHEERQRQARVMMKSNLHHLTKSVASDAAAGIPVTAERRRVRQASTDESTKWVQSFQLLSLTSSSKVPWRVDVMHLHSSHSGRAYGRGSSWFLKQMNCL